MSKIRVLHISTHNEECGIAKYQESIVDAFGDHLDIENVFFETSPNVLRELSPVEFAARMRDLAGQLNDFDILHIQHEYSFYRGDQLQRIVDIAKSKDKKVMFTLHTPPHAHRGGGPALPRPGLSLHSWKAAIKAKHQHNTFVKNYIKPLDSADLLITPSAVSIESFTQYGVRPGRFKIIPLPVPRAVKTTKSNEIKRALEYKTGDIILSMVGFISETKGIISAIKAIEILPPHYKLALIGGSHPSGQNDDFYNHVSDLIVQRGLQERVYITGYVSDDEKRDALVGETDICLYPYDHRYYDYVSSAALNNAVACEKPIVAYKTKTFEEVSKEDGFLNFAQSATYYELARAVQSVDVEASVVATRRYAARVSVEKQAEAFAECYLSLARG